MYQIHIGFHIRIRSISYAFFVYYIRLFCVRVFSSNVLLFGEFPNRLFRATEILVSKMDISACSKRGKKLKWKRNVFIVDVVSQAKQQMTRFFGKQSPHEILSI